MVSELLSCCWFVQIGSVETVKLKNKRRKKDKREFQLEDGTGSIWITLWGENIKQLRGKSPGDSVRVVNVKTSHYYDSVSLNSTDFTRIFKVISDSGFSLKCVLYLVLIQSRDCQL